MSEWFSRTFSEFMDPELAKARIAKEKAQEREQVMKSLGNLRSKLQIAEQNLNRQQKNYVALIAKAKLRQNTRDLCKYSILHKQCNVKLDKLAKIIVNVEVQILNVTTGECLLDVSQVNDLSAVYLDNLLSNITPESLESKIMDINDKEVLSEEMETTLSTPYSSSALSVHEEDEDLIAYANKLLGFDEPPTSGSSDAGIHETISLPNIPSTSAPELSAYPILHSPKTKLKSKKKKKLADMNIF